MTNINVIAPQAEFDAAVDARRITRVAHNDDKVPYVIYNYSRETQFNRDWDDLTTTARGLIVNNMTGEIVARPFSKFFNHDEDAGALTEFDRSGPVVVTDKADGSLGILYRLPSGEWAVSTRGSMNSIHADFATDLYRRVYDGTWTPREDVTYLFEIINPAHPIVLDYGDKEALILLGAVDKETGVSLTVADARGDWKGEVVEEFKVDSYLDALTLSIPNDREGVVIHFLDNDKRVKFKGDEYKRLHAILTNTTPLDVWRHIRDGVSIDEWLANDVPEEFEASIRKVHRILTEKALAHVDEAIAMHNALVQEVGAERKDFARAVAERVPAKFRGVVWGAFDGRSREVMSVTRDVIQHTRPHGDDSFNVFFAKNGE